MDHLLVVQVRHALCDLDGDVDCPVDVGFRVRVGVQIFVQAHATTQAHDDGANGRFDTGAYEQDQVGVSGLAQIEDFFFDEGQLLGIISECVVIEVDLFDSMWAVPLCSRIK